MVNFAPPLSGRRRTTLLVDDDRDVREMFREALRMEGFDVRTAVDGMMALWQIDQQLPDVIVLDLDLPGVSGIDFLKELRARPDTAVLPVIVVTGTDWELPGGVNAVLRKPVAPDTLVDVVGRAVNRSLLG
jgi:DNA-binding response OmpR family regulator